MNDLKVSITGKAQKDIVTIADYISKDNPKAALDVTDNLRKIFKMLAAFPKAGIKKIGIKHKEIEILRVLTKYQDLFAVL